MLPQRRRLQVELLEPRYLLAAGTWEGWVATSSDDAEQGPSGHVRLTGSDLELTLDRRNEQMVGTRFSAVNIPQGASIQNAYIQFRVDETSLDPTSLTIHGQAVDDAATFNNSNRNISNRTTTNASVTWSPGPWTTVGEAGPDQRTSNISAVIQEIVDRSGWSYGNSLAVIITGSGKRVAESFNGHREGAPLLHIEYIANDSPSAADDEVGTDEKTKLSGDVLAPNPAVPDSDPDGDSLTVSAVNGVTADIGMQITLASGASLTLTANGTFAYDPNAQFESLGTGQTATDTFSYQLNDGNAGVDVATVTITIAGINDSPSVAVNMGATVNEGSLGNINTSAMLNEGDPDDSGAGLTYTLTRATANGRLRLSGGALGLNSTFTQDDIDNNRITYDHNGSETRSDSFDFSLADGGEDGATPATGTFNIVVTPVNDIPTLSNFAAVIDTTTKDTEVELTLAELKSEGNEADVDGTVDAFDVKSVTTGTLKIGTSAATASVWVAGTNDIIDATNHAYWTPALNAFGVQNAFEVVAKDDGGLESIFNVIAQIDVIPDSPLPTCGAPGNTCFAVIGDYGDAGPDEADVANLVKSWTPDLIITTGDNNYSDGEARTIDINVGQYYHEFIAPYPGSYGSGADINRFFPSLGNHDWHAPNAQPYLDYFTLPGNERYYDFIWGPVHFFALDSDSREPDGNTSTSTQAQWLKSQLASSTATWKIVYLHHAPYSSGSHGSSPTRQWAFGDWGATAVLAGHDHTYERIVRDGIPYFVNGLGGRSIYKFGSPIMGSEVRYNSDFGAMLVQANDTQLVFEFISRTGTVVDSYTVTNTDTVSETEQPRAASITATDTSASELGTTGGADVPALLGDSKVGLVSADGVQKDPSAVQKMPRPLTNAASNDSKIADAFLVATAQLDAGNDSWGTASSRAVDQLLSDEGFVDLLLI